jgi:hypothetical protein
MTQVSSNGNPQSSNLGWQWVDVEPLVIQWLRRDTSDKFATTPPVLAQAGHRYLDNRPAENQP